MNKIVFYFLGGFLCILIQIPILIFIESPLSYYILAVCFIIALLMLNKARALWLNLILNQNKKIESLAWLAQKRKEDITTIRENLARDFHDETGNVLASISHQTGILKIKLKDNPTLLPILENIANNCDKLYDSSRDFLWSINNNSDNPLELFNHLTDFGQRFYNQFDISFSAKHTEKKKLGNMTMIPFASRNLIFIFKEAMTNVVKHSGADKVSLEMTVFSGFVKICLKDNGTWKEPSDKFSHYGLRNMRRRSENNDFQFKHFYDQNGTSVEVFVPITVLDTLIKLEG